MQVAAILVNTAALARDVGRVGDDQVERRGRRLEASGLDGLRRDARVRGVDPRQSQSPRIDVAQPDLRARAQAAGQDSANAGAGADVEHGPDRRAFGKLAGEQVGKPVGVGTEEHCV